MDFFSVLTMVGGLAMFLYGMNAMGDGLSKLSGGKLESILEKLTSNRLMAVLLGAGVTAVIQSSSATTVMVVGFVNSGIMKLQQAVDDALFFSSFFVDCLKQGCTVDGMNQGDERSDIFYLIGLEMTYEMPMNIFRKFLMLVAHFKSLVLAEHTLTSVVSFLQIRNWLCFRYCDKSDI